jgi:iron complex transport system substrate-binding protein
MTHRTVHEALGTQISRGLRLVLAASLAAALGLAGLPGPAVLGSDPGFPVTLVDDEGTQVTIETPPQRIISLSPANTETVFALGAGARLVGGTSWDDYPAEAADLPDVATFQGVTMEQVVDLGPDLVLAAGNFFTPPDDVARMRELGYPVLVLYAPDVASVLEDIELIGAAVGAPAEAMALTERMAAELDEVADAASAIGSRPRTFYQIGSEPEIYAPAPESFVADMVSLAGGEPITTSDPVVFSIPLEELVVADPEVIVVGDANYGVCPSDVAGRPGWGDMTAVREGRIRPVDDVPVTRPGPRLPQGLAALARAIHPDLELDGFPADPPLCAAG